MSSTILVAGGRLPDGRKCDLLVTDGVISEISPKIDVKAERTIDAKDCIVLPGLVDLHTHLREPGKEDAETVQSGSLAGVRGGFTALSAMANTSPVADTAGVVEQVYRLGQSAGLLDVFPIGAVTRGLEGEHLAEIGAMADSAARVRIFSDDGHCVFDPLVMRRALEYVKKFNGVVAQHAQEPRLTMGAQMNEGVVSSQLGLKGWPAIAEEAIIARDILLADHVQARLHICHLTTAGGVEIIRWAKARGISVTAEVTPHHLLLTDELARSYDPVFKVNPPLRTESDVMALREALADGTIDIVATDHAPHPAESKECEWQEASFGMLGLETALSIVNQTMVQSGLLTWSQVADRMSYSPARIGLYEDHGQEIAVGSKAHLTVMNPTATYRVDRDLVASRSRNTP
ncbi:MAG: dihydroorotase, partial [Actinobacteria bacterium]|nr:dihydroorotase [Actinomycetota bacterium]